LTFFPPQYAPFKPASKKSLYERAKALNLEEPAKNLLFGKDGQEHIPSLIKPGVKGLETVEEVQTGIKNIMSHLMAKNPLILNELRQL
jgi:hypothetical protein